MGTNSSTVATQRVQKAARPWAGFFLGLVLGLAVAILLQQAGIWPADQLLVFGSVGIFALLGILMSGAGRASVGAFSSIVPLLLAVAMIVYGALGLLDVNESGQLNGGCEVAARSDVDTTTVIDTSRGDPFDIDPNGGLEWIATSPAPIMDHTWHIYVEIGGFKIPIDDGGDPNEGGSPVNTGQVGDLTAYIQTVTNVTGEEIRGTFIVSGDIAGSGGACDGFGFVRLTSDNFFESLVSQIAAVIAAIALILLLLLAFNRYRTAELAPDAAATQAADDAAQAAGAAAAGAAAAGAPMRDDDEDQNGDSAVVDDDMRGAEDLPDTDDMA